MPKATTPESTADLGLEQRVIALLERATRDYLREHAPEQSEADAIEAPIELQVPRNPEHGDWAVNVAMRLAKPLRRKPIEIAEGIASRIEKTDLLEAAEAAPPGFINLRLAPAAHADALRRVLSDGDRYGRTPNETGPRVLVEFVSANPTGPLHIGHGRNAVVGDTLARIYEAAGWRVEREYYFNDAGVQMGLLGESLKARYLQVLGESAPLPEGGYQGEYLLDIARDLHTEAGDSKRDEPTSFFTHYASEAILEMIRRDLATLGIEFDHYFSETTLHKDGRVQKAIDELNARGWLYEEEGALWFRTSKFGDEKDRVVRKSDGTWTYLAPDIAYHRDKIERGYDRLINVLGADHGGYVVRQRAGVAALGFDAEALHVVLIQMVGVEEKGQTKKLSTRAGDFVPLADILAELGPDIVRFFFVMRTADSQLTFDLDLARQESMDNPFYYVQYAHARCCSLLKKAEETGNAWSGGESAQLQLLDAAEERAILFQIGRWPAAVHEAARKDDPLTVTNYLRELATAFHSYFSAGNKDAALRCLQPHRPDLTQARLTLIVGLRQTLANGMRLLGITPIERL